ncbi:MAG: acyl carrier protein [Chloroflexi bacterium]|nr:acyl carrier protein [Chloroflexota bacterium]|tara:strand:+ start:20870 stop:21133 length:264 start_codon:yes stop_codon:yes gene_type:complete
MATVFDRVKDLIVEQLGVDESSVSMEASFIDDLNADSLDLVELIMSMEEEFSPEDGEQIEISDDDAEKIRTVKDAVDFLLNAGIQDE